MSKFWNRRIGRPNWSPRTSRKRTSQRRRLHSERLENRQLLAANMFHNDLIPEDVNEDGQVTAIDALTVINQMSRQTRGDTGGERGAGRMTDVNNDGRDTAADALMVINRLNRGPGPDQGNPGRGGPDNQGPDNPGGDPNGPVDETDDETADDAAVSEQSSDVVLEWNALFNDLLVNSEADIQNPGYASRAMAMLNLGIYDAVALASGNGEDTFYTYETELDPEARLKTDVVASQAAYTILSSLYSDQQETIDEFLNSLRSGGRPDAATDASVELGTEIGNTILAARANDGSDAVVDYTYIDEPGYFQPDPLNPDVAVWGPAWGEVDPFAIASADDFTPETTPALTSEEYADSYNEVKELGSVDSTTRTADQTEAGIFWAYDRTGLGTPLSLFADVLETVAVQEGNTLAENAALFAQASVAMADAAIVAWTTKFSEQFWRPVTAIQEGDTDGNPLTEGDPEWTAIGAPDGGDDIIGFTPQFPTYISGHATFGGALFGALQEFYGTDDIAFDLTSRELEILLEDPELAEAYGLELEDAQRSFDSFSEAMAENGRSRVYLGIHFDFDDTVGQEVGQAIATSVSSQFVVAENVGGGGPMGPDDGPRRRGPGDNRGPNGPGNGGPRDGGPEIALQDLNFDLLSESEVGDADGEDGPISDADLGLLAQDQVNRRGPGRPDHAPMQDLDDDLTEDDDDDTVDLLEGESVV
ncbi:MAG: dockerin type I domain-containing protein [Planctomycetota bacterium]